jgi:hypothetical protein
MISAFAEWLALTDNGVKVFEDTGSKEQPAGTHRLGNVRMISCCEKLLKETN